MSFKAAALQMCSGTDPERNAASMARLVRDAAGQGASYIQTPGSSDVAGGAAA